MSLPNMNRSRMGPTLTVIDDVIWVIGGHDGVDFVGSIEKYDEAAQVWVELPADFGLKVPFHACFSAALPGLQGGRASGCNGGFEVEAMRNLKAENAM